MTHEQHLRLIEISIGLFGTLDAADTLGTDRAAVDKLHCAALALSRALKQLVEELDPIIDDEDANQEEAQG